MSADLKRCQELAEPLGWKIDWHISDTYPDHSGDWRVMAGDKHVGDYNSLAPIRELLKKEYRELAKQAQNARRVYLKIYNWCGHDTSDEASYLTRIADELAVKEPTMVERLKEERDRPLDLCSYEQLFLDALIQFGERLDAIERGKE